jgi:hypothetical protein
VALLAVCASAEEAYNSKANDYKPDPYKVPAYNSPDKSYDYKPTTPAYKNPEPYKAGSAYKAAPGAYDSQQGAYSAQAPSYKKTSNNYDNKGYASGKDEYYDDVSVISNVPEFD